MTRWALLFGVVAGCGSVDAKKTDAAVTQMDMAQMTDMQMSSTDAYVARCNSASPFGAPVAMALNTNDHDEQAKLTPDELTMYFSSTRTGTLGGFDLWTATRANRDADFANVTPLAGVNGADEQRVPVITADGLTLYALMGPGNATDIGVATRASTSVAFGALTVVADLSSSSQDAPYSILPDGSAIYLESNRSGTYKIYRAQKNGTGWNTPVAVQGVALNGAANDSGPLITANELTLFFSSDRAAGSVGGYDIWMATRTTTADQFGTPVNLQAQNTTGTDVANWISADGCIMYSQSSNPDYDLYVSKRGM